MKRYGHIPLRQFDQPDLLSDNYILGFGITVLIRNSESLGLTGITFPQKTFL